MEPVKSPFDAMLDAFRQIVREEIAAAMMNGANGDRPAEKESWLTPEQAAGILGVSRERVYRHARQWPFAKRVSRKALRINEAGLRRWLAARR